MNCFRVRTCLYLCSLTTGSKLVAWVAILASGGGMIFVATTFYDMPTEIALAVLAGGPLVITACVILLWGIYTETPNAIVGVMLVVGIILLGGIAMAVPYIEGYINGTKFEEDLMEAGMYIGPFILAVFYVLIMLNNVRLKMIDEPDELASDDEVVVIHRPTSKKKEKRIKHMKKRMRKAIHYGDVTVYGSPPFSAYNPRSKTSPLSRHAINFTNQSRWARPKAQKVSDPNNFYYDYAPYGYEGLPAFFDVPQFFPRTRYVDEIKEGGKHHGHHHHHHHHHRDDCHK